MSRSSHTATTDENKEGPDRCARAFAGLVVSEFKSLDFRLELQSMAVLLTVLAHAARLGCTLRCVSAADMLVNVSMLAPLQVAHRVESCLGQVIGVLAISAAGASASRR